MLANIDGYWGWVMLNTWNNQVPDVISEMMRTESSTTMMFLGLNERILTLLGLLHQSTKHAQRLISLFLNDFFEENVSQFGGLHIICFLWELDVPVLRLYQERLLAAFTPSAVRTAAFSLVPNLDTVSF